MSWRLLTSGILILALGSPIAADDSGIYESLDAVTIGRVFLGPAERAWLDAHRGDRTVRRAPRPRSIPTAAEAPEPEKQVPAAGYIIGSSGRPKVWQDGDFVQSRAGKARSMTFPGEVRVKRHPGSTAGGSRAQDQASGSQTDSGPAERPAGDGNASDAE